MNRLRVCPVFFVLLLVIMTTVTVGTTSFATEPEWPLELDGPKGSVVIYQPQPELFEDNHLTARAAVAVYPEGSIDPVFGAVWFDAKLVSDRDERTLSIEEIDIPQVRFPGATPEQEAGLIKFLKENFPTKGMTISQDRLMATLQVIETEKKAAEDLENAPPIIIVTTKPSVLVVLDGKPELQALKDSKIMRVVNTPFIILFDPSKKSYFLKGGPVWYSAPEVVGPWRFEADPPKDIVALAPKEEEQGEGGEVQPAKVDQQTAPEIIVVMEPAELIVSDGPPKYTPIPGADLMYMSNTESDVFLETNNQEYFVLLSGRWYRSASLEDGPWSYVAADQLPPGLAENTARFG